jgi:hypothetical protein
MTMPNFSRIILVICLFPIALALTFLVVFSLMEVVGNLHRGGLMFLPVGIVSAVLDGLCLRALRQSKTPTTASSWEPALVIILALMFLAFMGKLLAGFASL